jgi:glutamate-1-semialdehyde aminotransferase
MSMRTGRRRAGPVNRVVLLATSLALTGLEMSAGKVTATARQIRHFRDAATTDKRWESLCSLALLNEGFTQTPQMSGCVSTVTTKAHVDALLAAFRKIVTG